MSDREPRKPRRRGFDFDAPVSRKKTGTNPNLSPEALRRATEALRSSAPSVKKSDPSIVVRHASAPRKKVPPPRVLVITGIPIRKRIAESFFRKVLNAPDLIIESAGSVDEIMSIANISEFRYALIDGELQAWETMQMYLKRMAPNCKIKLSMNFAVDFKNFHS